MLCEKCSSENPDSNRFCGQCGCALTRTVVPAISESSPKPESPVSAASSTFRSDVARQESELRQMREVQSPASDIPPAPPLSKLATATVLEEVPAADQGSTNASVREPAQPWYSAPRAAKTRRGAITGPSFLGLSDSETADDADLSYLYEDDPRRTGSARRWIAALTLIAFLGFIAYQWKQNPNWQSKIVGWAKQASSGNASSTTPPPQAPVPPDRSEQQVQQQSSAGSSSPSNPGLPSEAGAEGTSSVRDSAATESSVDAAANTPSETGDKAEVTETEPHRDLLQNSPAALKSQNPRESGEEQPPSPGKALVVRAENLIYGRGVPKNCGQALVLLRSAADQGNAAARSKLGGLYATGNCVPLDRARAYNWFSLARQSGDHSVWVERNMGMLWGAMNAEERAQATHSIR